MPTPARGLVESGSTRIGRGSEHRRGTTADRMQILREAKHGLPIVEADRRMVAAHGEDVARFACAAEPLVKSTVAAGDCDVGHVTG